MTKPIKPEKLEPRHYPQIDTGIGTLLCILLAGILVTAALNLPQYDNSQPQRNESCSLRNQ